MLLIPFIEKNKHISGIFLTMKGDIIFDNKLNEHNLHAHFAEYSSTINFKKIDQRRHLSCGYKRERNKKLVTTAANSETPTKRDLLHSRKETCY